MKTIGVSKMGMNSHKFYQRYLTDVNLGEEILVENVNFDKPYDFILFDGGADVSPDYYGENNIASHIDKMRDDYEKAIFNHYKNTPTKFAGICRGHQLLNVLCGGSLYQNLGDFSLSHPYHHNIYVMKGVNSILKDILPEITDVNSLHHQAIKTMPHNLYPIAFEPKTKIVEIYGEWDDKIRAVQFHPEFYNAFPYTNEILRWLFRFYS